jgi:transposase
MSEKKNSQAFIVFLEQLFIRQFPTGRCVLVLDNATYHTSGESLAALSLFEQRVLLFWLPKYCSLELNPIDASGVISRTTSVSTSSSPLYKS